MDSQKLLHRCCLTSFVLSIAPLAHAEAPLEFFEREIRPIFAEYCYECHGPSKQEAGLRWDSSTAVTRGSDFGPVIVPNEPGASKLIQAVRRAGELKMPPNEALPNEAVAALEAWVTQGAPWPEDDAPRADPWDVRLAKARAEHWSLQPVTLPQPPATPFDEQGRQPLDRFIFARLAEAKLAPSDAADRRTLLRRLHHDLTGLPPTSEEVDAFVNDPADDVYERAVDRLLASPHFGERWARHWLDLARYSDTKGYVFEESREYPYAYTYRDYVIRSFNEDRPYDEFLTHQLAADRLDLGEDKTPLAALGFLTLGRRFIGNIDDITDDRIDVVTRGMLGLTVSCARCHDHKYDPISAADYYAMYGVFRSSIEPEELPLIETPDANDPAYQEFKAAYDAKAAEVARYKREQHMKILTHARTRVGDYLRAVVGTKDMETSARAEHAKAQELHDRQLQRWQKFLDADARAKDPVWAAWRAYAALDAETFADNAPAVTDKLGEEIAANARIAKTFQENPPATFTDVAERHAELLAEADKAWTDLLASHAQLLAQSPEDTPPAPEQLPDGDLEALRLALYAKESPANLTYGQAQQLFETPVGQMERRLQRELEDFEASHPARPARAHTVQDAAQLFDPYVFVRGKPENRGDAVPRRYLEVLSEGEPEKYDDSSGRLELARAITDPENPLTARVFVNRVWSHLFAEPLVDTPSDFGLRSEPPTHPELLDYLALEFVNDGWSVKRLIRRIVLSHTYQQMSTDRADARVVDPENELLWRQNRRRMDFETLRDGLLAASGRLDTTVYGKSVDITQGPPFPTRRTVYARIERQNLPNLFRAFDFAGPDAHSPHRFETTVPQQALYLLNSPFVVEQARTLASREDLPPANEPEARVQALYKFVYQRNASPEEIAAALAFIDAQSVVPPPAPPEPSAWQYGYGGINPFSNAVVFNELPHFQDDQWRAGAEMPDATFSYLSVNARGGHPGIDNRHASIRRWIAPVDGVVDVDGTLRHPNENGDGLRGYIVSSRDGKIFSTRHGLLWHGHVHNAEAAATVERVHVQAGDIIDFIAAPGATASYDSYEWSPRIKLLEMTPHEPSISSPRDRDPREGERTREPASAAITPAALKTQPEATTADANAIAPLTGRLHWSARGDFAGPPPPAPDPLDASSRYAQVLLLSNEFMFVD